MEEYLHFAAAVLGLDDDGRVYKWIEFFGLADRRTTFCMSLFIMLIVSTYLSLVVAYLTGLFTNSYLLDAKNSIPVRCCRSSRACSTNTFIILLPNE